MVSLEISQFPTKTGFLQAQWAPVILRPLIDSPEQLVVGVVVLSETGGFLLKRANSFDRLRCFYGDAATIPAMAANAAMDALEGDLATRGAAAIAEYKQVLSGISLGAIRESEGTSLEQIATSWLRSASSLFNESDNLQLLLNQEMAGFAELIALEVPRAKGDRLPKLVLDYVEERKPGLADYFSPDIRSAKTRRRKNAHGVFVDFAGSKLVCNFGTLASSGHSASVDRIKRRMWDLKIDRDTEKQSAFSRDHEMIVQHPAKNDPQFSDSQLSKIFRALEGLEQQADQEEIRFRPMTTVEEIGAHLVSREAA